MVPGPSRTGAISGAWLWGWGLLFHWRERLRSGLASCSWYLTQHSWSGFLQPLVPLESGLVMPPALLNLGPPWARGICQGACGSHIPVVPSDHGATSALPGSHGGQYVVAEAACAPRWSCPSRRVQQMLKHPSSELELLRTLWGCHGEIGAGQS